MHRVNKKYFGTDGIRDRANQGSMTPEFATCLGRATARVLGAGVAGMRACIGTDTRSSCSMLENALAAGFMTEGVDVVSLGVFPTPGVAYATRIGNFNIGAVISASHNPYHDNGIKFFGPEGIKLKDELEKDIEAMMAALGHEIRPEPGKIISDSKVKKSYINHLEKILVNEGHKGDKPLKGMKIGLDLANGATSGIFPAMAKRLGAEISIIGGKPDGRNINRDCGATHTEALCRMVRDENLDFGITFDGDGDRVLFADENGELVDGDAIMAIWASYAQRKKLLSPETVVTTVMANLGFEHALKTKGIQVLRTQVGDKYVATEMESSNAPIGGEQSGHIIFRDISRTGDGMATALKLISVILETGESLSKLASVMKRFPQILLNIPVCRKELWGKSEELGNKISGIEKKLSSAERILVRPSGTEPIIRVMAESEDEVRCRELVEEAAGIIKQYLS